VGSFISFSIGAGIPLLPYLLLAGDVAFGVSFAVSLVALFGLGLAISRLTRRGPLRTATRQLVLGAAAALVTYAVGVLIGVRI
jgi:VIT1/CCC1 family predicted Fe2+/Mn2+ transporter